MPSVLPGYEYDIFISYRQKDNKGDGWVSEFVEALKTELESTFKEEISVYFDVNPHDGLLETHDVAASLKEKLKCLVFIPIVSRTYCDPNSYAWEHEFKAFVEQATQDRFGLKTKLPSGNVASRVLPVRIHDLDPEDIKLAETYLGFIRPVDFIYKSAGVNRPLRASEDHPQDNLNKTYYRDQINKVANAIDEIIRSLKAGQTTTAKEQTRPVEPLVNTGFADKGEDKKVEDKPSGSKNRRRLFWTIPLAILAVIAAVLAFPKVFNRNTLEDLRKSDRITIAVMPFQNMTNDTTWHIWQNGIQELLITYLSNSDELRVRQAESINNLIQIKGNTRYPSITPSVANSVSRKLDAQVFVFGSINQAGETIRINAQLINSKSEEIFKSFQIESPAREETIFNIADSLASMLKDFLMISELEKEVSHQTKLFVTTNSPEAYRYYIHGTNAFNKYDYPTAINLFQKALFSDPDFNLAAIWIAVAYGNMELYVQAKEWCLKVFEKKDKLSLLQRATANWAYATYFESPYEEIKYLREILEFDDQIPMVHYMIGLSYNQLGQFEKAIPEGERALKIYHTWKSKPSWAYNYTMLAIAYHKTGQFRKEKKLLDRAEDDFPSDPAILFRRAVLSLSQGDSTPANRYITEYQSVRKDRSVPEPGILTSLASIYSEAGMPDKTEEYYRQALALQSDNPVSLNNLAFFLINQERNITEGLTLADRALELSPDNYEFLDTKGWGMYKQGKNAEALQLLQQSWDLKPVYNHGIYLHLEEVKKTIADQKLN